jgi:hypothetical protein
MAFVEKEDRPFQPESEAFSRTVLAEARSRNLEDEVEETRRRRHKTAPERGK